MRIAVMGAGSTGGFFGGMLARAGNDVFLIARGANLEALRANGLKVIRDDEEFTVQCNATDDPSEVGPVDLVLLCVKTYQSESALPSMKPLVGPGTTVLCLQNGIDSYLPVAAALGKSTTLPGAAFIEANLIGPGVVRQSGSLVRIILGEPFLAEPEPAPANSEANPDGVPAEGMESGGHGSERCQAIRDVFMEAGIPAEVLPDISAGLWGKFLFIATMAGITSMARAPLSALIPQPAWRKVVEECLTEVYDVGRGCGVDLPNETVPNTVKYIEEHLADLQASMHTDIMGGRPLELEALTCAVIRSGIQAGVPTPVNDVIYAMLKDYEHGSSTGAGAHGVSGAP
ncbi:MAG: 2-dehydropantoate 2-reductase [Chloroflexi bacterium]|nr:2-dehydropantoate 2-reductase [Chloroflexota bacterium]MDA1271198.1 2-dehydropantoate 2-reductase [Chloroflexota bacterium]